MRRRKARKRGANTKKSLFRYYLLVVVVVVFFILIKMTYPSKILTNKFVLVQPDSSSKDISVLVLDFAHNELTNILIPGSTLMEVSGNLGQRKASNLWNLARDEKKDGYLVASTISKNFSFPIDGWVTKPVFSIGTNMVDKIVFAIGGINTNFDYSERIKIAFFLAKKSPKVTKINLGETEYLMKSTDDGEDVFGLGGEVSQKVLSYFVDDIIAEGSYKIMIRRSVQNTLGAENMGKIIETLGVKPAYSGTDSEGDYVCKIRTVNTYLLQKLTRIFPCNLENSASGVFDAEITLGNEFGKLY